MFLLLLHFHTCLGLASDILYRDDEARLTTTEFLDPLNYSELLRGKSTFWSTSVPEFKILFPFIFPVTALLAARYSPGKYKIYFFLKISK
jgi:hypothetical protein